MRLLLVEDEARLAAMIAAHLRGAGFVVDVAPRLADATAFLADAVFDAILLDRGLPDGDGLQFLKQVRRRGDATPVLVLTAQDAVDARVEGLDSGADDYLVKPFALTEMLARVRALLRRPGGIMGKRLAVGNIAVDTVERVVTVRSGNPPRK
jgi:DNA-binding response OmpR family regulator